MSSGVAAPTSKPERGQMANKSDSADQPETTTLNPEQNQPQPETAPAPEPEPEADSGGFPKSLEETAARISANRAEIQRLEANLAKSQAEINRLRTEVDVLNALRQVHGTGAL